MNRKLRNARAILFFESTKSPLNILVFILYLFTTFHRNSKKRGKISNVALDRAIGTPNKTRTIGTIKTDRRVTEGDLP